MMDLKTLIFFYHRMKVSVGVSTVLMSQTPTLGMLRSTMSKYSEERPELGAEVLDAFIN